MTSWMLSGALALAAQATQQPRDFDALVAEIAQSGRILTLAERPADRLGSVARLAPGRPPVFAFRYIEGARKHRFGNLNLVMDDAGH